MCLCPILYGSGARRACLARLNYQPILVAAENAIRLGLGRYLGESVLYSPMSKPGISFTRRAPDNITEELVAVLSSKDSFEFKPLFDIILLNLRERNAASGGEEMLRLRSYEKLQGLVNQGAVTRTVTGITKKYKGVSARMVTLSKEMKVLRADWSAKLRAKAAAAN